MVPRLAIDQPIDDGPRLGKKGVARRAFLQWSLDAEDWGYLRLGDITIDVIWKS